jgi:quercetin dioxygenase-like cupin family protein
MILKHQEDFTWEGIPVHPYKEDGTHFKSIVRHTLFKGTPALDAELRYFEIQADGHSTLERHDHVHLVVVIRGSGEVFVGDEVTDIGLFDLVHIPPQTWHQFRATKGEALGFLCIVNPERDRPHRPDEAEAPELVAVSGEFVRL